MNVLEAKCYNQIKMEYNFDSEGWNIKDGVQDGGQLGF